MRERRSDGKPPGEGEVEGAEFGPDGGEVG